MIASAFGVVFDGFAYGMLLFLLSVGLNLYIVNAIAPDVPITRVMWGTIPYVLCMMLAIVILCVFPEIATWLPDEVMGPVLPRAR